jgi:Carboxypeptidase regulatory-like domain
MFTKIVTFGFDWKFGGFWIMTCRTVTVFPSLLFTMLVAFLVFSQSALTAQTTTTATVTGFVSDPSGAKSPGATVTFMDTATGVASTTKTNGDGSYRIAGLLPGIYRSTVSMSGFKTTVRDGIDLHVEDQVSIDYTLSVGSVSESVTVSSASALIETQSPTVSQVIEGRQVLDTPLNGRNVMNLVSLTPGVIAQGSTSGNTSNNTNGGAFTNPFAFNNYQIAGGLAGQSSVYLDGTPLNLALGHTLPFVVPQDDIQEFRVETSVINPQYGEFGGGIINFATKSGTDNLHGTAYEYLRNNVFNANTFFNNQTIVNGAPVPRPEFTQNQFGATLGGPIKKNKVFYFGAYEGFRLALGVPNVGYVPTPAELNGDFTADAPIYDPKTQTPIPGTPIYSSVKQFSCNGVANKICPDRIDPTSNVIANVLKYFPTPNVTSSNPAINFSQNGKAGATNNSYNFRVDASLGAKQEFFGRYTRFDGFQPRTQFLTNPVGPTSLPSNTAHAQEFVLGDTIVLNPTSVLDLRASYLRNYNNINPQSGANLAEFGPVYASLAPQIIGTQFPDVVISNIITNPFTASNPTTISSSNNYVLSGAYSKTAGRHSLSFGGEARRRENYFGFSLSSSGFFVFAGTSTACIPYVGASTCRNPNGVPFVVHPTLPGAGATPIADFLTGVITVAPLGFQEAAVPSAVNYYGGMFANDTFQVSQRLTITAGLRYELPGGFTEKNNRNTVLVPQLSNPLVLVDSAAYSSRSDIESHLTLFSPRIGVAFQPQAGTSIRAGYSLVYLPVDTVYSAGPNASPVNSPITFVIPGSPLSNPLLHAPNNPVTPTLLQPIGRGYANDPYYFAGQTVTSRIASSPFPYLQQWNANLQQALSSTTVLQIAYLGARGDHLPIFGTFDINQLADKYDSAPSQALRPYPMYQDVNAQSDYVGDSYYNSLQTTVTKRFSSGSILSGNYSWSKFLGDSESTQSQVESHSQGLIQDYTNLRAEKSYLSFDVPQRLVVSYILDLPVGNGKRFLSNASGIVQDLVGGWNATGINTFQSGYPLAIVATNNNLANLYGAGQIRPNFVAGCDKRIGSIGSQGRAGLPTLNSACFTAPAGNAFGDQPRTDGSIRGAGVDNWDFSIGKTTPIHENVNLVFRAEAFNVINRVQFGDPNVNSASSLFGVITTQANQPRLLQFSLRVNY